MDVDVRIGIKVDVCIRPGAPGGRGLHLAQAGLRPRPTQPSYNRPGPGPARARRPGPWIRRHPGVRQCTILGVSVKSSSPPPCNRSCCCPSRLARGKERTRTPHKLDHKREKRQGKYGEGEPPFSIVHGGAITRAQPRVSERPLCKQQRQPRREGSGAPPSCGRRRNCTRGRC